MAWSAGPTAQRAVPFVDLAAQYETIKDAVGGAILDVLESSQFVLGPQVADFERRFARYAGTAEAVAVNSGTSALHLALLAAGVEPGDEVITTPFTFIATVAAIDYCGARPVFVDIDPATCTIDPSLIESAVTERTKVIMPVHLYGRPADMDPILDIAGRHDLTVVEDAAQSHGAEYHGRRAGSIGRLGCFSFYPGKNLGAYGEGGAVTTDDPSLAHAIRVRRDWGAEQRYHHDVKGYNYRMDGIQGAVLGVKMGFIEGWTASRQRLADRYDHALAPLGIALPPAPDGVRHVRHVYAVRHRDRDDLQAFLTGRSIATGIHYPIPVHLQRAFAELGHAPGDFPHAEQAAAEVVSLPLYPELDDDLQDVVIEAVADWVGGGS